MCEAMGYTCDCDPIIDAVARDIVRFSKEEKSILIKFYLHRGRLVWNYVSYDDDWKDDKIPWEGSIINALLLVEPLGADQDIKDYILDHSVTFWKYIEVAP